MKVKELLEMLESVSPEATIVVEGCDCEGDAVGIDEFYNDDQILICRRWSSCSVIAGSSKEAVEKARQAAEEREEAYREHRRKEQDALIERFGEEFQDLLP